MRSLFLSSDSYSTALKLMNKIDYWEFLNTDYIWRIRSGCLAAGALYFDRLKQDGVLYLFLIFAVERCFIVTLE